MKLVFNFRNENGEFITSKSFSPIRVDEHGVRKNIMHHANQILNSDLKVTGAKTEISVIDDNGETVKTQDAGRNMNSWRIIEAAMDTAPLFAVK